jgi:hypothetical protein
VINNKLNFSDAPINNGSVYNINQTVIQDRDGNLTTSQTINSTPDERPNARKPQKTRPSTVEKDTAKAKIDIKIGGNTRVGNLKFDPKSDVTIEMGENSSISHELPEGVKFRQSSKPDVYEFDTPEGPVQHTIGDNITNEIGPIFGNGSDVVMGNVTQKLSS